MAILDDLINYQSIGTLDKGNKPKQGKSTLLKMHLCFINR
jgi:hypothetical protein